MTSSSSGGGSPGNAAFLSAKAAGSKASPLKIRLVFGAAGVGLTTTKHCVSGSR